MPPKYNPLKLNPLQLRTLTLFQAIAAIPGAAAQLPGGEVRIAQFPNAHGDHFGKSPSTPATYQFRRCSSGSVSVLPAGTFTAPD